MASLANPIIPYTNGTAILPNSYEKLSCQGYILWFGTRFKKAKLIIWIVFQELNLRFLTNVAYVKHLL
jgi:hypothetical protein